MVEKIIITLDGYSSCGKSTLAKQLAQKLNYVYVDSGAMYRAITLYFLRNDVDLSSNEKVNRALSSIKLEFKVNESTGLSEIFLNGEHVEDLIRELIVAEKVSEVAAIKEVRSFAVAAQQALGSQMGIVMDGRDIGTTVFPGAALKFFMTADGAVRVQRRFKELIKQNPNTTLEEVRANLEKRDYIDTHREISPLRKADDAVVLDNTNLSHEQQLAFALSKVYEITEKKEG